jgi:hypothetical protein
VYIRVNLWLQEREFNFMVTQKTRLLAGIPEIFPARDDMGPNWRDSLINKATLANQRRKEKIPDAGVFNTKLAGPATEAYSFYVPAGYIGKSGRTQIDIQFAHRKNITTGFDRWNDKLELSFETVDGVEAKRFKDQVSNSVDAWTERVGAKTLRMVGDKIRGQGLSVIVPMWLTADKKVPELLRAIDAADGAPYDISYDTQIPAFRAALTQLLTQSGILIINSDLNAAVVTAQNNRLTKMLTGLSDRTKANEFAYPSDPVKSYCAYAITPERGLYLEVRIMLGA